ncbi:MAG: transporter substrate-binding domain-containing protein [Bacteroidales bacterium]|nr:transporter substrate-binding domain-containing protein [Bacteroidales bacterium]
MKKRQTYIFLLECLLILSVVAAAGCRNRAQHADDLELIEDSTLTIITLYSSSTYFLYKGEPMGYEYEMAKNFADSKGLKLEVRIAENASRLVEMLENGDGDLIAYQLPITNQLKKEVIFCGRESVSPQVLIQRSNRGDTLLRDVTELLGKEVYVKHNTKQYDRLVHLDQELGGGIIIKDIEKDTVSTEDLIEMVSNGLIPYTVSDRSVAQLNKTYFQNINYSLSISFPQRSSWAVRKDEEHLAEAINKWSDENKENEKYKSIHKRYFELSKHIELENFSGQELLGGGKISPFDSLFMHYGKKENIDWRLLAALSFQESGFNPNIVAWSGAEGLMGILPQTADKLKFPAEERRTAEGSIRTGASYLNMLRKAFSTVPDPLQRLKFIVGSYNAGIGHVQDAQALAKKYGKDPKVWDDNVEEYIRLKSLPEYYNDSVTKNGYLRGNETYNYVRNIFDRWDRYKKAGKKD